MTLRSLLLDVNVVLDVLLDRQPHAGSASGLWDAIERKQVRGYLAAHGVTTIHYLIGRERGAAFANAAILDLLRVFDVAPVDAAVLRAAAALRMKDFEDAVCAQAALAIGCDAVVTRDASGYRTAAVPVLSPGEAVARIRARSPRR